VLERDNIRLVGIAKILQSLEGCACPMEVLSREFLKKLRLNVDEVVIVDMEAGVEHFGRGVETSMDNVLVVVEPSLDSLQLAEKVNSLASGIGINDVRAVLNKVTSDGMAAKLREELSKRNMDVIGCIHYDPEIFDACLEGRPLHGCKAAQEVAEILDTVIGKM